MNSIAHQSEELTVENLYRDPYPCPISGSTCRAK
ncbi:hypothetical protein BSF44_35680 [Pseudomonas sp. ACN8]|nr:hypothetical protein BSF44_35680 [Pseudomonas sp. ACN8]